MFYFKFGINLLTKHFIFQLILDGSQQLSSQFVIPLISQHAPASDAISQHAPVSDAISQHAASSEVITRDTGGASQSMLLSYNEDTLYVMSQNQVRQEVTICLDDMS